MPEGFSIQDNPLTLEQYDKLMDDYPWAYGPNQEYFKELKKEEEEKEKLKFLEKVSLKSTSKPALSMRAKAKKPSPSPKALTPPPSQEVCWIVTPR